MRARAEKQNNKQASKQTTQAAAAAAAAAVTIQKSNKLHIKIALKGLFGIRALAKTISMFVAVCARSQ